MNQIIEAAFSRTSAVLVSLVLLFVVGISSYLTIPKEAKPDIDIPVAYVSVSYEGISPEDAERLWSNHWKSNSGRLKVLIK